MAVFDNQPPNRVVRQAFLKYVRPDMSMYLASPFFSYSSLLRECHAKGASINLIVRLGTATNADELEVVRGLPRVKVRFFSGRAFHTKLYIFGTEIAVVGSANLTESGCNSNSEACISVGSEKPEFDELVRLFNNYWQQASTYDEAAAQKYLAIWRARGPAIVDPLESGVSKEFGGRAPSGIQISVERLSKDQLFIEDYKRKYQNFLTDFSHLQKRYLLAGFRRLDDSVVPLRIEIDQFLSWVREKHGRDDEMAIAPLRKGADLDRNVDALIAMWRNIDRPYLFQTIPLNFSRLKNTLGRREALKVADEATLLDALETCHAFSAQRRFFDGGKPTLHSTFVSENGLEKIKSTLDFLLFGPGDDAERIAGCVYDQRWALRHFSRACVQELLGWINNNDHPIWNGRTSKALRFLGYEVEQLT